MWSVKLKINRLILLLNNCTAIIVSKVRLVIWGDVSINNISFFLFFTCLFNIKLYSMSIFYTVIHPLIQKWHLSCNHCDTYCKELVILVLCPWHNQDWVGVYLFITFFFLFIYLLIYFFGVSISRISMADIKIGFDCE